MDKNIIKSDFLNRLPKELMDKLPKIYGSIIDEGIDGILSGRIIYNGRVPETSDEWYIALGHYFVTASAAFRGQSKEFVNITEQSQSTLMLITGMKHTVFISSRYQQ